MGSSGSTSKSWRRYGALVTGWLMALWPEDTGSPMAQFLVATTPKPPVVSEGGLTGSCSCFRWSRDGRWGLLGGASQQWTSGRLHTGLLCVVTAEFGTWASLQRKSNMAPGCPEFVRREVSPTDCEGIMRHWRVTVTSVY